MGISEAIRRLQKILDTEGDLILCDGQGVETDYVGVYIGVHTLSEKKNNNMSYKKKADGKYACIA